MFPRVIVISNNSFSKTGSNGRSLGQLVIGWPKDKLAQFCISTDTPDYDVCSNYYLVTDKSALNGFLHFRKARRCVINNCLNSKGNFTISHKRYNKSPVRTICRNVIWWHERWKSLEYKQWINDFNPQVILLMNSDSIFMFRVAIDLSKDKRIPIVMYNTEGFYFFKKPYTYCRWWETIFFRLYQCLYRHYYSLLMNHVSYSIYANSKLQDDYYSVFRGKSMVIYTGSRLTPLNEEINTEHPVFCYIGNLEYSRIDALIEVAEVLQSIDSEFVLNVYGKYNDTIAEKAKKCKGLLLKGFIDYDRVVETIYHSDVLFHAETQNILWAEALKYGFSTKIADSICSGKCFVMYSSPDIAGAYYLQKTGAGWHASSKEELKTVLMTVLYNKEERNRVLLRARKIAERYHQSNKNCAAFQQVLNDLLKV